MRKKISLYFIGLLMGIADVIPGVSGGTIAFICGIYEDLLQSIKSLQLHSLKKVHWAFILPLGLGICTSILLFSRLLFFLLITFPSALFGLFFGLIIASAFICGRKIEMNQKNHFASFIIGALLSFFLSNLPTQLIFGSSFFGILLAGILAAFAMLLPGISGSYLLQLIGVYPFVLYALNFPFAPGAPKVLISITLGIVLGFVLFSRMISFLLTHFHKTTMGVLVGFMIGGLRALWPFNQGSYLMPSVFAVIGFVLVILLEMRMKRVSSSGQPSSERLLV